MRVAVIIASVLGALSLRTAPANKTNASRSEASNEAIDAVMSMVGAMQDKLSKPQPTHAPSGNASHGHTKLDLGFTGFEANLTQQLTESVRKVTPGPRWTDALRNRLIANVTASVSQSLKDTLKDIKQSVGKTWMALPEDDQKDVYVNQLRHNFEPVFADSLKTMVKHFNIAATRVSQYATQRTPMPSEELLTQSETELTGIILSQRCFTKAMFLQLVLEDNDLVDSPKVVSKPDGSAKSKEDKFCMPSVISKVASRLNDAQGLLSMTMRFDAGAMDLAQTSKKNIKK